MRQSFVSVLLVGLLAMFALTACSSGGSSAANASSSSPATGSASSSQATTSETVTFTDDLGNQVTVPYQPKRVVACMGSFADIWQLAGGSLVGAADEAFDDYGIDAATVKSIGGFSSPNLEAILALEPDFVICTGATSGRGGTDQTSLAEGLAASNIPVAYFTVTTFDDYLRMLKTCTDITGNAEAFAQYGTSQQQAIDAAIAKYSPAAAGKNVALMITYSSGVRVQNAHTQTGDMLADLGYKNITDETPSLLQDFSVESLLEINPDYILVIPMGNNSEEAGKALETLTSSDAWQALAAVQQGRFHTLSPDLYVNKPDARWAEAYETLGATLQG